MTHFDNQYKITRHILRQLNVSVTATTIRRTFQELNQSSLESIATALHRWHVETIAIRVESDQLVSLPFPAIAQLSAGDEQSYFIDLLSVSDNEVIYFDSDQGVIREDYKEFSAKWTGIALLVAADKQSGEADYKTNYSREVAANFRKIFQIFFLIFLLSLGWLLTSNPAIFIIATFYLGGSILSWLLIREEYNSGHSLLQSLCQLTPKTNCKRVLRSPAASLGGLISMAEIGFIYFTGNYLCLLLAAFAGSTPSLIAILFVESLLCMPYTIFSIYYQAKVIKQWCPLCVGVQSLIWLLTITMGLIVSKPLAFSYTDFYLLASCLSIVGFVNIIIKPYLNSYQQIDQLKRDLLSIRQNKTIFQAVLSEQSLLGHIDEPADICLGNPQSPVTIIVLSNPFCKPCALAHQYLSELLFRFPDRVRIIMRFVADIDNPSDERVKVVRHMYALANYQPEQLVSALDSWFGSRNFESWANLYPIDSQSSQWDELIRHTQAWSEQNNFIYTPAIILDGKLLPTPYRMSDLVRYSLYSPLTGELSESASKY
ncbi:thioredoxin-like protein [Spirosoma oryzae]|uniref:Thioredoxin-like protein n=1 Tax=Spirosoma oryzae TaxID=1469603 RepID=A0A2T0SRE7_9BACT|nr:vitamin K epoxide reductase family protein [Spirosoma oryzae]PRY35977.1 thioredoxin-like protein [Spirosoma oryzae]